MAVAFDTSAESHTGTAGNTSAASFDISVVPAAGVKGLLVYTFTNANADDATSVTLNPAADNLDVPAVSGGRAIDSAGEAGDCKAWFLGSPPATGWPSGTWTVRVNRTNNADEMYAVAITVTAGGDTAVNTAGINLVQTDGTNAEASISDGIDAHGVNSLRFAGINSGLSGIVDNPGTPGTNNLSRGTNSTEVANIDFGTRVIQVVRETTAGTGSRSVGFSASTSDDRAAVHLAVYERITPPKGSLTLAGLAASVLLSTAMGLGSMPFTGYAPTVQVTAPATDIPVPAGSLSYTGQSVGVGFIGPTVGALAFTGLAPSLQFDVPIGIPAGSLVYTGLALTLDSGVAIPAGVLAYTGLAPTVGEGSSPSIAMPAGALVLTGQSVGVSFLGPTVGSLAFAGLAPSLQFDVPIGIPVGALSYTGLVSTQDYALGQAAGALAVTGYAPNLGVGSPSPAIDIPVGVVALTGQTVGVAFIGPTVGVLAFTGYTPTVSEGAPGGGSSIAIPAGSLVYTGIAPVAQNSRTIDIPAGSLVLSGQYVAIAFIDPSAGSLVFTGLAPTVSIGAGTGTSIAMPAGSLVHTGRALTIDWSAGLPAGSLVLSGQAPSVNAGLNVALPAGSLVLAGLTPTVLGSGAISPSAGSLVYAGQAPTLQFAFVQAIPAGGLTVTGYAPIASPAVTVTLGVGVLTLQGLAPTVLGSGVLAPPTGVLAWTGQAPSLRYDLVVGIPAGAVVYAGRAVSVNPYVVSSAPHTSTSPHLVRHTSHPSRRTTT